MRMCYGMARIGHYHIKFQRIILLFCWISCMTGGCAGRHVWSSREQQLERLTNYDIITPYRLAGRERREATTTTEDGHLREASFVVPIFGKEFILDISLNENLFPAKYVERSYTEDGNVVTRKPHPHHHCYYHGNIRNTQKSSVAISTCNGLSGVISIEGESYFIEPLEDTSGKHLVYRPQDTRKNETVVYDMDMSGLEEEEWNKMQPSNNRIRRDIYTELKYIELVIVNDYQEFVLRNEILSNVQDRSKEIANIMDMIYRPLNVRVALVGVETWNQGDFFTVSSNPGTTMSEFQRWRKNTLLDKMQNDNAQFLTGVSFDGSTVGMASLGTMCSEERSGGVSQDHDMNAAVVASTMAHEMGHNLGFIHDSAERNCMCDAPSQVGCVMEPSSGHIPPTNFSTCSFEDLESSLKKGLGACLLDYPNVIYGGPICGNGFLEEGEECDCGSVEECDNDCCIPETCRLHENATCANGECCENCHMKKAGDTCREMVNECDLPEYCTGNSAMCPENVYRQNGEQCADMAGMATCYDGQCLTLDQQCINIWGPEATAAHDKCFNYNTQGSTFGNCGTSGTNFAACQSENKRCGKLMCEGGASYPILSSLARASQGYIWDENSVRHTCKSASIDLGQDVPDPGYVAMGSLCAPGFVCSDFRCQNLSDLNIIPCPMNCHNNGVCNSKNHCHCDPEWNPPLCNTPGYGGSIDSGPARPTDEPIIVTTLYPNTTSLINMTTTKPIIVRAGPNQSTVVVLLVLFLCVLPGLALIGILIYCKRHTVAKMLSKGKTSQYSSKRFNKPESSSTPSWSAPARQAPPAPAKPTKPTIHHTHLHETPATPPTYRYERSVPSVTTRPPPVPINKPREPPAVQRPPPQVPLPKGPTSSEPARPTATVRPTRPAPPAKPPSPVRSPVQSPTSPTAPPLKPLKPAPIHSSNKPQFRLPPPAVGANKPSSPTSGAPQPPLKPPMKPPVPGAGAKAALKPTPVPRPVPPKPNANRNNSKELDEKSTFIAPGVKSGVPPKPSAAKLPPSKPGVTPKPVPAQKPSVPNKPAVPSRPPALKPLVKRDPVV